jgi:Fe-S cluster assembly scaffold protein SufB
MTLRVEVTLGPRELSDSIQALERWRLEDRGRWYRIWSPLADIRKYWVETSKWQEAEADTLAEALSNLCDELKLPEKE